MVSKGQGRGGNKDLFCGYWVSVLQDEKFLEIISQQCEYLTLLKYILKNTWTENCMLGVLYHHRESNTQIILDNHWQSWHDWE